MHRSIQAGSSVFAPTDNASTGHLLRKDRPRGGAQSQLLQTTSVFWCQQLFIDVTINIHFHMMHLMTWMIRDANSESVKSPSHVNRIYNSHLTFSGYQWHITGYKIGANLVSKERSNVSLCMPWRQVWYAVRFTTWPLLPTKKKLPWCPQSRRQGGGQNAVEKRKISGLCPESSHDYSVVW